MVTMLLVRAVGVLLFELFVSQVSFNALCSKLTEIALRVYLLLNI